MIGMSCFQRHAEENSAGMCWPLNERTQIRVPQLHNTMDELLIPSKPEILPPDVPTQHKGREKQPEAIGTRNQVPPLLVLRSISL